MEQYFRDVVSSLSIDEMNVLGILFDNDATATFKSMIVNEVLAKSGLSEAMNRKIMHRLVANMFINVVVLKRKHSMYITRYGVEGLKNALSKEITIDVPDVVPLRVITSNNLSVKNNNHATSHDLDNDEAEDISREEALSIISV